MAADIKVEYKGFTIEFDESMDKWSLATAGRSTIEHDKLSALKARVDDILRKEKAFEPQEAFLFDVWTGNIASVIVSSSANDGGWWIKKNGSRSKVEAKALYLKSAENFAKVNQISANYKYIQELQAQQKLLMKSLELFTLTTTNQE